MKMAVEMAAVLMEKPSGGTSPSGRVPEQTPPDLGFATAAALELFSYRGFLHHKLLKKMGLLNKEAMKMPGDESSPHPPIGFRVTFIDFLTRGLSVPVHEFLRGLLFIYGIHLHQLTPNSLMHISIFITLCECFLGIHPHWGLWKRIFYLRRNISKNIIYNVGGVCICVRPDVDYFDVNFADFVQGLHRKWLYIKDESSEAQEYGLAPFDATKEIHRRKSWDAEATAEGKAATDALIACIHELQNTDGAELSGVQIIAHFLRIRVQPLQARKNPLRMYSGAEDADRISDNLFVKDLEKLVRRFTSLNKNHEVPSSYRVEPFSGSHALPKPLMKELVNLGSRFIGFRDEAATLRDALHRAKERADDLEAKLKASKTARKKVEKDAADVEDLRQKLQAAEDALSNKEAQQVERENNIVTRFETQSRIFLRKMGEQYTLSQESDDRLLDALDILELNCDLARKCITSARNALKRVFPHFFPKDTQPKIFSQLAQHFLEKDDTALAYRQASLKIGVEGTIALVAASGQKVDLVKAGTPKGLNSEKWKLQAMKKQVVTVLDQSRKSSDREKAALRQAYEALELKESAIVNATRSAQRESYMIDLMTDASQDMAGSFLDTATEEQRVNSRVEALLRLAKANDIDFWAHEDRTRRIVQFQDRAAQVRDFLNFCTSTLAMVYNAMFPRNPQPGNLPELMGKFKDVRSIHDFVKAQMIVGAKLSLIWLRICHSK
ncbi:hypothetical protein QYE76_033763 [Lolium multiflorum]|uniref:Transposase (putative) gypsy type domain-containing protein n=1 Tax=Lolium multiflorum TaxID=4521 RepID=A0AAD8QXA7_LOLMU|nr:hypothetical protein QYE76_033763 [Lolium multiflorum]